jgi:hypothetical protein
MAFSSISPRQGQPPWFSDVLDLEKPPTHRPTDGTRRYARADSDDVTDELMMGRASDPRRIAQTGD